MVLRSLFRVGHCALSRSECPGLSHSFKERSVHSRSIFEFLATYEAQKNGMFFPVLFNRMGKNVKNVPFFCKERERMQRLSCSFIKNGKECENVSFFCKRTQKVPFFFQYLYIDVYRYVKVCLFPKGYVASWDRSRDLQITRKAS